MAQTHSAALATAWAAAARTINAKVEVAWNGSTWTDETARVEDLSIGASLLGPAGLPGLGAGTSGRAMLTLDNHDNRYSPDNAAGPLYAHIADGIYRVPIRIALSYVTNPPESPLRQFTGEIEAASEQEGPGSRQVSLDCIDATIGLLQAKHSTTAMADQRPDELLALLLAAGGAGGLTLDRGMSIIPWAWLDDENIWPECQDIAAADGGVLYADELGGIRYERMTHWLEGTDHTTSQATLDRGKCWWYMPANSWRDCYSAVIVERAPRYLGATVELYRAPEPIEVPPGQSVTENCRFRYPAYSVTTPVSGTDYKAVSAGMADLSGNVSRSITAYAQHADLTFTNSNAYHAAYILDLVIRGTPLLGEEAQEVRRESSLGIIPEGKEYPIRGNPYLQDALQAERLAGFLRDRLQRPRRLLTWRGAACPWLQLGDRVTVNDAAGTGFNGDGYVLSKAQSYRGGDMWEMELVILPASNLYAYTTYFRLGTSAWATTSHRLFY